MSEANEFFLQMAMARREEKKINNFFPVLLKQLCAM